MRPPHSSFTLSRSHRRCLVPPAKPMAATHDQAPLLLLVCARDDCGAVFYLCCHCYRGQRYCSRRCARLVRGQQLRLARRRYRQSPAGRARHRVRSRAYRLRRAKARWALKFSVVDQSSQATGSAPPYQHGKASTVTQSLDTVTSPSLPPRPHPLLAPYCIRCGRPGVVHFSLFSIPHQPG